MISFIVSVFDRQHFLAACLASLDVQDKPNEVIVCANHTDPGILLACEMAAMEFDSRIINTGLMGAKDCYESANMAAKEATGEWLCFASDDSLYVCKFSAIMLRQAERSGADIVYCDCVYAGKMGNPAWQDYSILDVRPQMGRIDKTCFIVKRDIFLREGFKPHPRGWSDGQFVQDLVARGIKHCKADGVLLVHQ